MAVTLAELARRFHGKVRGNPDVNVERVASLDTAGPRDITFFSDKKYLSLLTGTSAGAVIISQDDSGQFSGTALIVDNPHLTFAAIASLLHPFPAFTPGVHATAVVHKSARLAPTAWVGPLSVIGEGATIGEQVFIGPGCVIGEHVSLGERTRLVARVVINDQCMVGGDCLFHPGAVIGSDGFGYAKDGDKWAKVPQLGRVMIGHHVEVGANTSIDRGALKDTVIADGVKLDNQIQIAHNVRIGENTAIAACVGIAGSTVIGKRCTIGGQAGITGHLDIADDVHITAGSLVTSSIDIPGIYSASLKAEPVEKWRRNAARLHHLDEMAKRVNKLEEKIERLSKEQET
jgi:UDP-3-O-[3-hydroxymyristoyl] glucosamine N-acyltransferase